MPNFLSSPPSPITFLSKSDARTARMPSRILLPFNNFHLFRKLNFSIHRSIVTVKTQLYAQPRGRSSLIMGVL